jgi:hypothetical protein
VPKPGSADSCAAGPRRVAAGRASVGRVGVVAVAVVVVSPDVEVAWRGAAAVVDDGVARGRLMAAGTLSGASRT